MRAHSGLDASIGPAPGVLPLAARDHGASTGVPANHPLPPVLDSSATTLQGRQCLSDSEPRRENVSAAGDPSLLRGDRAYAATSDLVAGGPSLPRGDRAYADMSE